MARVGPYVEAIFILSGQVRAITIISNFDQIASVTLKRGRITIKYTSGCDCDTYYTKPGWPDADDRDWLGSGLVLTFIFTAREKSL